MGSDQWGYALLALAVRGIKQMDSELKLDNGDEARVLWGIAVRWILVTLLLQENISFARQKSVANLRGMSDVFASNFFFHANS